MKKKKTRRKTTNSHLLREKKKLNAGSGKKTVNMKIFFVMDQLFSVVNKKFNLLNFPTHLVVGVVVEEKKRKKDVTVCKYIGKIIFSIGFPGLLKTHLVRPQHHLHHHNRHHHQHPHQQ